MLVDGVEAEVAAVAAVAAVNTANLEATEAAPEVDPKQPADATEPAALPVPVPVLEARPVALEVESKADSLPGIHSSSYLASRGSICLIAGLGLQAFPWKCLPRIIMQIRELLQILCNDCLH